MTATGQGSATADTTDDLPVAELASALRLGIMRTARRLRSQRADALITLSQLSALATVVKSGPLSAGDVATIERVQPPSMTKILASLESLGLITRSVHETDRRQSIILATDAGHNLLDEERRTRDAWLAARLRTLPDADVAMLGEVIRILDQLGTD